MWIRLSDTERRRYNGLVCILTAATDVPGGPVLAGTIDGVTDPTHKVERVWSLSSGLTSESGWWQSWSTTHAYSHRNPYRNGNLVASVCCPVAVLCLVTQREKLIHGFEVVARASAA